MKMRWFTVLALLLQAQCVSAAGVIEFPAALVRVIDGDTLVAHVEVWPDVSVQTTLRVAKINAPESRGGPGVTACEIEAGLRAKAFTARFVEAGAMKVVVHQHDKYGRTLADVKIDGKDLAAALLEAGLARPYGGEKRAPWCVEGRT